jgi:hypothetical protein
LKMDQQVQQLEAMAAQDMFKVWIFHFPSFAALLKTLFYRKCRLPVSPSA